MLHQIVLAVFSAAFLSALAVYLIFKDRLSRQHRSVRTRLQALTSEAGEEKKADYQILKDKTLSDIPTFNRVLSKFRFSAKLQSLIDQSGVPVKAGVLVLGMLSLGGLVFLLLVNFLNSTLLGVIAAFLTGSLPYLYVHRRRKKRAEEFESLLPEAIDLMTNALKSGFSLEAAMRMVASEIPDPVGIEFAVTFEEQNLGVALTDALSNMLKRVQSEELSLFTTALLIQKKTGGNLVEILEKIATTVRERFILKREVKIFTAQGRFSGFVLIVLPIVAAIVIFSINPEYLEILLKERAGNYLLGAAIILQLLGIWVIKRIINIKL
jgi:tight adherence protein B